MGQTLGACLPCGREPLLQLFPPLGQEVTWWWESTANLFCSTRPGGILEVAEQAMDYTAQLARFENPDEPLDMVYASLHTYWIHQSNIPLKSVRLVRRVDPGTPGVDPEQLYFLDDVLAGTWTWEDPNWLGLERANARYPGSIRWFDAVPGTYGWVHRSDVGTEVHWQMTLVPVCNLEGYTGDMMPLPN